MNYLVKSGIIFSGDNQPLAQIKGVFSGYEKTICSLDGTVLMRTVIQNRSESYAYNGDVRNHEYLLLKPDGTKLCTAKPDYEEGSNPSVTDWPVCRPPQVDHAILTLQNRQLRLIFQNSQNYTFTDTSGTAIIQIYHRGLTGGWNIETTEEFQPAELCGFFVFCRYLEQENEQLIVF